jgi:hypothetical protein
VRLLVVIPHYYRLESSEGRRSYGSDRMPFARIAAFNAAIVALNRYYGARRRPGEGACTLDIVVVTVRGANLLEWIGLDASACEVEYFEGSPPMLPFEVQRIVGERAGAYDVYAYLEDDLIIDDPAFFEKILWFAAAFGPNALLTPLRYEMSYAGAPARIAIDRPLKGADIAPFSRSGAPETLTGTWNGKTQTFRLPENPHSAFFAVTDDQLKVWMRSSFFYDRDASWIGPIESAATFAPSKVFALYHASAPDPWFLAIEHFGAHYATLAAADGEVVGEPPLLAWAEAAAVAGAAGFPEALAHMAAGAKTSNVMAAEVVNHRGRLEALERSRSKLAAALARAIWRKAVGARRTT